MMTSIEVLAKAIGYPDELEEGASKAVLAVDDRDIGVSVIDDRFRLTATVFLAPRDGSGDETIVRLAGYAAGRILKEEAVIAWDPDAESLILWQEFPADASEADLRRFFEVFMASLEWWLDRAEDRTEPAAPMPEYVIMP